MTSPLWINAQSGLPAYDAGALRRAMALALLYDGVRLSARGGVRPGGGQLEVSLAGSTISVQPGIACLAPNLSSLQGPYWVAVPQIETHQLVPADATNPRRDKIVLRGYDDQEDSSGLRIARTEYLVGTPSPTPAAPATPLSAFRLAEIDVPRAGSGAPVVTNLFPFTVASGGTLPVRDAGDRNALSAFPSERVYRLDVDREEVYTRANNAWETIADPEVFRPWTPYTPVWTAITTQPAIVNGSILGAYKIIGRTVHYTGRIVMGSSTTYGSGGWRVSLPVPAVDNGVGVCILYDSSTAGNRKPGVCWTAGASLLRFNGDTGDVDASNPFVWAAGDQLRWSFTYEAA